MARLYATLANGGELDGVRLLSPLTIRRAAEVQNSRVDHVVPLPMNWRLGYHRVASTRGTFPEAFGHSGFGGSSGWADPSRKLAVGYTVNSGMGSPFGDFRILRINSAIVQCTEERNPLRGLAAQASH